MSRWASDEHECSDFDMLLPWMHALRLFHRELGSTSFWVSLHSYHLCSFKPWTFPNLANFTEASLHAWQAVVVNSHKSQHGVIILFLFSLLNEGFLCSSVPVHVKTMEESESELWHHALCNMETDGLLQWLPVNQECC
jgi:hypothetical protein